MENGRRARCFLYGRTKRTIYRKPLLLTAVSTPTHPFERKASICVTLLCIGRLLFSDSLRAIMKYYEEIEQGRGTQTLFLNPNRNPTSQIVCFIQHVDTIRKTLRTLLVFSSPAEMQRCPRSPTLLHKDGKSDILARLLYARLDNDHFVFVLT